MTLLRKDSHWFACGSTPRCFWWVSSCFLRFTWYICQLVGMSTTQTQKNETEAMSVCSVFYRRNGSPWDDGKRSHRSHNWLVALRVDGKDADIVCSWKGVCKLFHMKKYDIPKEVHCWGLARRHDVFVRVQAVFLGGAVLKRMPFLGHREDLWMDSVSSIILKDF